MIKLPSMLSNFNLRKDNSSTIRFESRELTDKEWLKLKHMKGLEGWLLFDLNKFTDEEIPEEETNLDVKSPSKRLRSVLFVYWKQQADKGKNDQTFNEFYQYWMERIIGIVKDKLD